MMKPNYEMRIVTLDRYFIETLELINPRAIRTSQVQSIYKALCEEQHFDSNFVVNKTQTKTRVIDGGHRLTAIKQYFKLHPDEQIQVYFAIYNNLDPDEERKIFTRWNIGISQSIDDFIHSYKDTIPMYNRLITELPCTVYGSNTKLKFKDITTAYFTSFEKPYRGGWARHTRLKFITDIQRLRDSDVDTIIKNFKTLWKIFNEQEASDVKNIVAFKNIIYRGLYYLVANAACDEESVIKKMKKNLVNRTTLSQYSRFHGRNAAIDAFNAFQQAAGVELSVKPKPPHLEHQKQKPSHQKQKPEPENIKTDETEPNDDEEPPKKEIKKITKDLQSLVKERKQEEST